MSRVEARGKFKKVDGKRIRFPGKIRHDEWQAWLKRAGVTLRGGDLDEAPQAYKRLDQVLDAHSDTINILHQLTPIGVAMAGEGEYDPYKD